MAALAIEFCADDSRKRGELQSGYPGIPGIAASAPLNRHGAMLSTTANPTDGLRFDGDAKASPQDLFILVLSRRTGRLTELVMAQLQGLHAISEA